MPANYITTFVTTTVAASPSAGAETVIATLAGVTTDAPSRHVDLDGWAAFTVGTSGVQAQLRIRQTSGSGTVVANSGLTTVVAGNLVSLYVAGFDAPGDVSAMTYVLTLTIGSGAATSTVSACKLRGILVQ